VRRAVMPVSNFARGVEFFDMGGASAPACMGRLFESTENDPETRRMAGIVITAEEVRLRQANGVDEFRFYSLNRPDLTYAIAHVLRDSGAYRILRGVTALGAMMSFLITCSSGGEVSGFPRAATDGRGDAGRHRETGQKV